MKNIYEINVRNMTTVLPEKTEGEDNAALACAANRNLAAYGYTLTGEAVKELACCSKEAIFAFYEQLIAALEDYTGAADFKSAETFYPNFPEEVMEKEEAELYLNSLLYYFMQYTFGDGRLVRDAVTEKKEARTPLLEEFARDLKVIRQVTLEDTAKEYAACVHGLGVSAEDLEDALAFTLRHPEFQKEIFGGPEKYASNETKVKVAEVLYLAYKKNPCEETFAPVAALLSKTNDILRFYAVLGGRRQYDLGLACEPKTESYANLSFSVTAAMGDYTKRNVNFPFTVSREDKRFLKKLLNAAPDLYSGVWLHEQIWQKAFTKFLDISKKDGKRLNEVKDNLYAKKRVGEDGKAIFSPNAEVNFAVRGLANGETSGLKAVAKKYPGLFAQRYNEFFHAALNGDMADEDKIAAAGALADAYAKLTIPVAKTLQLVNLLSKERDWEEKAAKTKSGRMKAFKNVHKEDGTRDALYNAMLSHANAGFEESIRKNAAASGRQFRKVYLDDALTGVKIPQRNRREASDGATLARNSVIPGIECKNLIVAGIYWKGEDIDIDLSAKMWDKDYACVGNVWYGRLRKDGYAVHSGDYLTAPRGAIELVMLDKEELKKAKVKYVSFHVHGYSSCFSGADDPVRFVISQREGAMANVENFELDHEGGVLLNGEPLEVPTFDHAVKVSGGARDFCPLLYSVSEDRFVWVDEKQDLMGLATVMANRTVEAAKAALCSAFCNATPDMVQLIRAYVTGGCGVFTEDLAEADTVFLRDAADVETKEGAAVYTAHDLGFFSELAAD